MMMFDRLHAQTYASDRSGIAAVEFVMVMPILIVILFGTIEVGRLVHDYHVALKSVRSATRYLSRLPGIDCAGVGAGTVDAGDATLARNLALTGSASTPTDASDYLLRYWTNAGSVAIQVNCIAKDTFGGLYDDVSEIPRITMTATIPYSFLLGTLIMDNDTLTMTVSHNEVHVGE